MTSFVVHLDTFDLSLTSVRSWGDADGGVFAVVVAETVKKLKLKEDLGTFHKHTYTHDVMLYFKQPYLHPYARTVLICRISRLCEAGNALSWQ